MNLALDKITGAKISASKARERKTYKCPVCLAPVLLVNSSTQIAHFRHQPHTAKPDCPFYHTGSGYDISPEIRDKAFRTRRVRLFAKISRNGSREQWQLVVVVPRIEDFSAFNLSNSPNFGRIRMDSVESKGRELPVDPVEDHYTLRLFSTGATEEELVDGLTKTAIFHLSASLGARIEEMESLLAGASYTIIHQLPLRRAAPSDVELRELESVNGWHASIFRLPTAISDAVKVWAADILGATIRDSTASASLIWPPTVDQTSDGAWLISTHSEKLIVGVRLPATPRNHVRLVHGNQSTPSETWLNEESGFLNIVNLPAGYHELQFAPPLIPIVPLVLSGVARKPRCEAFTFEIAEGDTLRVEMLWSKSLAEVFGAIRDGKAELREIGIPKHCEIEWKSWMGGKHDELRFSGDDVMAEGDQLRQKILEHLKQRNCRFSLDAGGFGSVHYSTSKTVNTPAIRSASSQRMHWLRLATLDFAHVDDGLRAHTQQLGISS